MHITKADCTWPSLAAVHQRDVHTEEGERKGAGERFLMRLLSRRWCLAQQACCFQGYSWEFIFFAATVNGFWLLSLICQIFSPRIRYGVCHALICLFSGKVRFSGLHFLSQLTYQEWPTFLWVIFVNSCQYQLGSVHFWIYCLIYLGLWGSSHASFKILFPS